MKKINNKLSNNRGYTIIEVMATIALLSLLFTLVNTSVMSMERQQISQGNDVANDTLYFNAQDLMVKARESGEFETEVTLSAGLWRGFNPLDPAIASSLGFVSGFDVAYMVEYPDYTWEDPTRDIDYSVMGIDVDEGYQLPFLKDLIEPEEGCIQAYGILFELHTGTILETNVVSIPYDTGSDYTEAKARAAAKMATTIVGDGVRNLYQAYYSAETTVLPLFLGSAADATYTVNGYGDSHLFNRANMFSSCSDAMFQARLNYIKGRVIPATGTFESYLAGYSGCTLDDVLTFTGLVI